MDHFNYHSLKKFIYENCHLPDVPPATQIAEEGIMVYEMQLLLLKKVEELTLHAIQQHEEIAALKQQIRDFKNNR